MGAARRDERGAAATELVLVTPVLISLLLLVALGGRLSSARGNVLGAARDAARAASIEREAAAAPQAATAAADAALSGQRLTCRSRTVDTETDDFRPGGTVAVEVACVVSLADLALVNVPGSRTIKARSVEVIDVYRGVEEP